MTLRTIDLAIIVAYMVGTMLFGAYFGKSQKGVKDYFVGGGNVPWWAIAFSIVATETSTVTFISVPGFAYDLKTGNMTFLQLVMGYMIGRIIITLVFIPSYFKGELLTVYQILDQRFGAQVKQFAASLFLITRSLADGVRLFATALVLVALTGWTDPTSIIIIGLVTIIYTYLGGMSAVIWTDVIQLFIYLAGAVVAAAILLDRIPGGWGEVVAVGQEFNKFQVFDFGWNISKSYTFWAGVFGGAFLTTATHGTDQLMVQRYLCARSPRQATVALLSSGAIVFAQFVLFLLIGVMLFVFYHHFPPATAFTKTDRVFPTFIVNELPAGVVGLVIAAIFAAAMSTLSSSLNSSAATALGDFYRPLSSKRDEAHYLRVSRWLTALWGVVQIGVALIAGKLSQRVVDEVLGIAAFTNGSILGVFFLGTLTHRVRQNAAFMGMIGGIVVMLLVKFFTTIAWPWHVLIGSAATFSVGYLASFILAQEPELAKAEEERLKSEML